MSTENSKTRGDATEITIIHELITSGYMVSVPFGDNDPYDLVVDADGEFFRVQCKTGWKTKNDTIRFNTHSQTTRNGEYLERSYQGEIDAFAVYSPDRDVVYWVNIDDATEHKMDLRYDAKIDHPSINWAHHFEFNGIVR